MDSDWGLTGHNTINSEIASFNAATGGNCILHAYEGGYSSAGSSNQLQGEWYGLSHDVRYLPVWRIYEKDFFALIQQIGYKEFTIYAHTLYWYYQNCWNVYTWMMQQPGIGDGSDGKFDNRTCLFTSQYPGYTAKASNVNQDELCDSVRGQAFNEWMAAFETTAAPGGAAMTMGF